MITLSDEAPGITDLSLPNRYGYNAEAASNTPSADQPVRALLVGLRMASCHGAADSVFLCCLPRECPVGLEAAAFT
jgi:hypothetical protein